MSKPQTSLFTIEALEQRRAQNKRPYLEFLRVPAMSAGLYVLTAGASDLQTPHDEDEMYCVIRGCARFRAGDNDCEVSAGSVLYVAAKIEHKFYDITEELAVLVFFAPAETQDYRVPSNCRILPMLPQHWAAVRQIYGEGISTGNATFETELPEWQKWDNNHRKDCRVIAVGSVAGNEGTESPEVPVLGWAALSPVSARYVYRGVAEVSVYVTSNARGRGVGKALLQALIQQSEAAGIWTLQAGIFPENTGSIALHKACGFYEVGVRRHIGKLNNTWRDVLLLERKSETEGI